MIEIKDSDLERLKGISLNGALAAEKALHQLTGLPISIQVRDVRLVSFPDVPALLGGDETAVTGIHLRVFGDCRANALLALTPETALGIIKALFPPGIGSLDKMEEMERSGLTELGNIFTTSYMNALSDALELSMIPSVPALANDMAGAIVDVLLIEQSQKSDSALVIQTIISAGDGLEGSLLLMPDPASLPLILDSLRRQQAP